MALTWLAADLRAAGLDVREIDGWQTRARPGTFDPVGVLIHHTGTTNRTSDAPSLQVCISGRVDLAGPLCQLLIARSGVVYVIAGGRCNHAGEGALAPVVPTNTGNTKLVGIELENLGTGTEAFPARQVEVAQIASAVVLRRLGQPAARCWGHKEYTTRKPDPRGIDMNQFRAGVAIRLANPGADMTPAQIAAVKAMEAALNTWGVDPPMAGNGDPEATARGLQSVLAYAEGQIGALSRELNQLRTELEAVKAQTGRAARMDALLAAIDAAVASARA